MRTITVLFLGAMLPALAVAAPDESWRQSLADKEKALEANIVQRHNILGLYPSLVEVPLDGSPVDITTRNPFADIQHAVCWTANYLAGLSYKYAYLKKSGAPVQTIAAARRRVDEVFEAVYRCQRVTGVPGLQARGYLLGHGYTYAERFDSTKMRFWQQGEVDGQALRWVGDPSHHNYSDAIHGLGQYYDLAAEGEQKERAREAIDRLVGYWVDNDLRIYKFDRSLPPVPILGFTDGKTLNMRVMMAIAGAKVAHHATGKEKYKKVYDQLIAQYHVLAIKDFKTEIDFDDGEHVFCHLENLFRIEQDPALRAAYRHIADGMWANYANDAQSLFTYIYYSIAPDAAGRDQAFQDALYTLQSWPTDMTMRPRMSSLNKNLKPPYPVYAAAWDNEYIWKGNLLRADGWLSRIVADVTVAGDDPMVIFAVDPAGTLYESRDGARTPAGWEPIGASLTGAVRAVDTGARSRILAVACDDGFYITQSGGGSWRRMPVPADGGAPIDILFDSDNANTLYATTSKGVYRSTDFGAEFLGQSWESLTDGLPQTSRAVFTVALGEPGRIYAALDGALFSRSLDREAWTRATNYGIGEVAQTYPWLIPEPGDSDHVIAGFKSSLRGVLSIVQHSRDAGAHWTNDMRSIFEVFTKGGYAAIMRLGVPTELTTPVYSKTEPGTLYAGSDQGFLRSGDGGDSWQTLTSGLDIPIVRTVFAPRHSAWIFAGTPAGLYLSKDGGTTWQDANLRLQFTQNTRRELGGAAFLDAYWRARYYGFID